MSNVFLNTGDNITLVSRANITARVADLTHNGTTPGNTITGKVIVERFIPARRAWRLLTAPIKTTGAPTFNAAWQEGAVNVDAVTINDPRPGFGMHVSGSPSGPGPGLGFDPTPLNNASIKQYDAATDTWSGIPNTTTTKVNDREGYMVFVRGNRSILAFTTSSPTSTTVLRAKGDLRTGVQSVTIPATAGNFAIVGNPFASTIDFKKLSVSANITASTYVLWDPNLTGPPNYVGAYQYFTQLGGPGSDYQVVSGGGSYGAALSINNMIQSSQAFAVQRAAGTGGTVTVNENAKAIPTKSTVFRPLRPLEVGLVNTQMLSLNADSSAYIVDGVLSLFDDQFSNEVDLEDFRKLNNIAENLGIAKDNNTLLQIERKQLSESDTIFYKMSQLKLRDYQLMIKAKDLKPGVVAYLEDEYLKTRTMLQLNNSTPYTFKVTNDSGAWNPNRFRIIFKTIPVTSIKANAITVDDLINVDWNVEKETAVKEYELEKSADAENFVSVKVVSNPGNNNQSAAYQWLDLSPADGDNYYRIKCTDITGRVQYSNIAKAFYKKGKPAITVYPNPVVDDNLHLHFIKQQPGNYVVRLLNLAGQLIAVKEIKRSSPSSNEIIRFPKKILHGAYKLEVSKPDGTRALINVLY